MATRGKRPKPAHLRLVDGTHDVSKHGKREKVRAGVERAAAAFGKLERPKYVKGEALKAWRDFVEPAFWLDGSKLPLAVAFCELWAEFMRAPRNFNSSRHSQMRAYMAELGISDERNRPLKPGEDHDEFFDA